MLRGRRSRTPREGVRAEIQALRAVAVLTVVVYHLWPAALPGGFVGVDVFFVISGFLITGHLLRELERSGRISPWRFWARRARRLLPAALLVLLACAIATLVLVPQVRWQQFLTEIGASTAYVQNWQLAADAVDYLAADNSASPVQHFWSLSVEEQFYVFWPLLLGLAAFAARRRAAVTALLLGVAGVSLAYSISATAANPAAAFFVTPTRVWEFAAGGLLALAAAARSPRPAPLLARLLAPTTLRARVRDGAGALLSWGGLAAIAVAAATYSDATPFPGSAALLPVLGALAVIAAGLPATRLGPSRLLRVAPAQFVGDISYSIYLWHWPLLVLAPFAVAGAGATTTRVAVLALTLLLAWATKLLVEDPVRRSSWLTARPRATFAVSGAATAVVAVVLAGGVSIVQAQIRESERAAVAVAKDAPSCFGAAARDPRSGCEGTTPRGTVVPRPVAAREEPSAPCDGFRRSGEISVCSFGVPRKWASRTIALVGDSHAGHWRAPLDIVAGKRGWHGLSIARTSCPYSLAVKLDPEPVRARCRSWVDALPEYLRGRPQIDTLFVAAITGGDVAVPPGATMDDVKVDGVRDAWARLPASVKRIVVIRDTPRIASSTIDCVERALADGDAPGPSCAVPRSGAQDPDPQVIAARRPFAPRGASRTARRRTQVIDLTRSICSPRLCFPVVGGALVFRDTHHFTRAFAETLAGPLGREVERAAAEW